MNKKVVGRIALLVLALMMAVFCVQCGTPPQQVSTEPTEKPTPKPVITAEPVKQGPFEMSDLTACAIYPGMTTTDVRERLDKRTSEETGTHHVTGAPTIIYYYKERQMDMDMYFDTSEKEKGSLYSIIARTDRLIGPREFKHGDSLDAVLAAFAPDSAAYQTQEDGSILLYGTLPASADTPSGVQKTTDDGIVVTFTAPAGGDYPAGTAVVLEYTFDPATETMVAISWYVGPLA